jgi:hypothetical protein
MVENQPQAAISQCFFLSGAANSKALVRLLMVCNRTGSSDISEILLTSLLVIVNYYAHQGLPVNERCVEKRKAKRIKNCFVRTKLFSFELTRLCKEEGRKKNIGPMFP